MFPHINNHMKQRIILIILATLLLTGCNTSNKGASTQSEDSSSSRVSQSTTDTITTGGFNGKGTIEETVLVDQQGVKITASNLTYDGSSAKLNLLLENNTDKNLSFVSGSIGYSVNAVNGYSISSVYVNSDISPGMKSNQTVSIDNDELNAMGITDIAEIELGFKITDDNYDDYLVTGPLKLQTTSASSYDLSKDTYQEAVSDGRLKKAFGCTVDSFETGSYFSSGGIDLISAAIVEQNGEREMLLELQNTTDQVLHFSTADFAVNNIVISPSSWDSETVNPGGRAVMTAGLNHMLEADEYTAFNITDLALVSFHASVKDADGNDISEDNPVTISLGKDVPAVDDSGTELYNKDGIRIIDKGTSDSSSDHNILLLVINDYGNTIYVSDEYNTTSVNGFMTDELMYGKKIDSGQAGALILEISDFSLKDNNLTKNDISTVSFQLNIAVGNYYNYIDQPVLTINYQ